MAFDHAKSAQIAKIQYLTPVFHSTQGRPTGCYPHPKVDPLGAIFHSTQWVYLGGGGEPQWGLSSSS